MKLDPDQPYCPDECPFLRLRPHSVTRPVYCDKFRIILTTTNKNANRCSSCLDNARMTDIKKFKKLLDEMEFNGGGILSRENKTLLENLFKVLDASEKKMMMSIMQSPGRANAFLDQFNHQPKGQTLLKDTRRILYEMEEERKQEMEEKRRTERERAMDRQRLQSAHTKQSDRNR